MRGSSIKVPEKCPDYYGICPDILKKSQNYKTAISGGFWGLGREVEIAYLSVFSVGMMVKTESTTVLLLLSTTSSRRMVPLASSA